MIALATAAHPPSTPTATPQADPRPEPPDDPSGLPGAGASTPSVAPPMRRAAVLPLQAPRLVQARRLTAFGARC
ncbi:MAG: hypothetical protein ACK40L_10140 [Hydrogenophaga sp.]|jgi:hypothetical protein